jgi:hypothetical protein
VKPRLVPYLWGFLILVSPAISLALMFALSSLGGGCRVHEGFPEPCRIVGIDFSNILYYLGLWGAWGFFFSWFLAGVVTIPWLAIHLWLVISEAVRKRAASKAQPKKPIAADVSVRINSALDVKQAVDSPPRCRPPTGRWRVPLPRNSMQWIGVLAAIPFAMMFVNVILLQPLAGCATDVACLDSPYIAVRGFTLLYKHSGLLWFVCLVWLPIVLVQRWKAKRSASSRRSS